MAIMENVSTLNDSMSVLSITLKENTLKKDGSYYALVSRNTATFNNILAEIAKENTGLDPYMLQFATIQMQKKILEFLQQGKAVNLFDICTAYISYQCKAKSKTEAESGGTFSVRFSPTTLAQDAVSSLSVDKVVFADVEPEITAVTDVQTEAENETLTIGSVAKVTGSRLKLGGDEYGLYIAPVDDEENISSDESTWISVDEKAVFRNMPSELNFIVPDALAAGTKYRIVVRTSYVSAASSRKKAVQAESAVLTAQESA